MQYIIVILLSYLIGSSSMSYYIGKLNGIEVNKNGSKNLGASNTMALIGWKAGIIVALHDILKSVVAILLIGYLFSGLEYARELAGVCCILGHIFPFYLNFKGGKGFASYYGMILALDWKFALGLGIVIILVTVITDYIVSATFTTIISVPLYYGFFLHQWIGAVIMMIATLVMFFKHKENIARIINGTEVGLRSANRGEHRVK